MTLIPDDKANAIAFKAGGSVSMGWTAIGGGPSAPNRLCSARSHSRVPPLIGRLSQSSGRFLASASCEVHRETLEIAERAVVEGTFVSGL